MVIKDAVNLAKYSELSSVSVKNNIDAIVAFMNLGVLELYKRFPIKVKTHTVEITDSSIYYPMPDDFMYVIEAYKEIENSPYNETIPVAINDEEDPYSIFFTSWNTLQVPAVVEPQSISLTYVAKPANISVVQAEDGVSILDMPDALVDALLCYIGYRAHLGVKSDGQAENNAHWARFERSCSKAIELGVGSHSDYMGMTFRISARGFV